MINRVRQNDVIGATAMRIARSIARFAQDTRGNIAMLFMLMSSVLFLFIGGSVDYTRFNSVRTDILDSLDAASLAIARMEEIHPDWTEAELVAYGEKFFVENAKSEGKILKDNKAPYATISEIVTFDLTSDDTKVRACVNGTIETYLLPVVNIRYLDIDQCVGITKFGAGRIELALVLDVTGSMDWNDSGGNHKMTSLKKAVVSMLDVMFEDEAQSDNLKIGVVPFNQHVNAGGASSWQESWGDTSAESFYHGARFIHVDENGNVDMNTKVNHYKLYDSDPDRSWEGCVESRPYPLDELDTPPGTSSSTTFLSDAMTAPSSADEPNSTMRSAFTNMPSIAAGLSLSDLASAENSRFVPVFLGDEPDCDANWNGRCAFWDPSSGGMGSYWEDTVTITVNGSPYDQNFWRSWFVDPDTASNISEGSYPYRNYIDDELYTGLGAGVPAGRYARVVEQFRYLDTVSYGALSANQQKFYDVMEGMGVDEFHDTDITAVDDSDYANSDEYILRNAYVGWWNPATEEYDGKYDLPKSSSAGANPSDCPPAILPMTDTRANIDGGDANNDGLPDGGLLATLSPNGGTNISNGAVWGWRVVSDNAPFSESTGPADTGPDGTTESDWQRAVVIMTDGNNDFADRSTHWGSSISSYGYEIESRMGDGIDEADGSGGTIGNMEDEADNKLLRICRRMKQDDILVYTIVFDVSTGSTVDNVMKACATEPNQPYYYNAPNASQLEDAFSQIAADLVDLHISQ